MPGYSEAYRAGELAPAALAARGVASLERAWAAGRDHFPCLLSDERSFAAPRPGPPESFTMMLVADHLLSMQTGRALVSAIVAEVERELAGGDRCYFFKEHARLPADADCTAIAYLLLLRAGRPVRPAAHRALDAIVTNVTREGLIQTYFDPGGERDGIVDAVVGANVVRLACALGRFGDVAVTWHHIHDVIVRKQHLGGSRYYPSPDTVLYFATLAADALPAAARPTLAHTRLAEAVDARRGATDLPLDLALRVLAARRLGLAADRERAALAAQVGADGTWPADGLFCYGRSGIYFGAPAVTTAYALAALAPGWS